MYCSLTAGGPAAIIFYPLRLRPDVSGLRRTQSGGYVAGWNPYSADGTAAITIDPLRGY